MSDKSADESPDSDEGGVGDRRVWATPTVTEHRGLAVEGGAFNPFYQEDNIYEGS